MQVALVDNKIGVSAGWLMQVCGLKRDTYQKMVRRGNLTVIGRGGGKNQPAIIQWSNMDERFRSIVLQHGNPEKAIKKNSLTIYLKEDVAARQYFADYRVADGRNLHPDTQLQYYANAVVLNAVGKALNHRKSLVKASSGSAQDYWKSLSDHVQELDRSEYPHDLPGNPSRLMDKYKRYRKEGYKLLVHKNYCNQVSRKVDEKLERLLLSLYCQGNKPYGSWVHEDYLLFLAGKIDIVDTDTGEVFDRSVFVDRKGDPLTISEATVWNYVNNPMNRAIVDSIRMGYHKFGSLIRPHYHRTYGKYSLSKVSLDDRDLPRKMHDGNRVKAYYAYDVMSGCLIGAAYSKKKDSNLFIDCLRDMFRFIDRNGFGMPLEAEVENHLVRQFEPDLMRAGLVFPFVHWCAPTNSQEKHAEQFNRQKKYGYEKRYQDGIGRFYLKDKSNQTDGERVYDEKTDRYIIREKTYDYEQLKADDLDTIIAYNNGLHRDQKRFPGKTRMEVLRENLNPELVKYDRPLLARYIGEKEDTSIRRSMYCRVKYADYMLPRVDVLSQLAPGNYNVQAFFIPVEKGNIGDVYLYQNDSYLCMASKIEKFTTARAEWTDADGVAQTVQAKFIANFDKGIKDGSKKKVAKVATFDVEKLERVFEKKAEIVEHLDVVEDDLDELIDRHTVGVRERAFECV
jgi:hypothetical protein